MKLCADKQCRRLGQELPLSEFAPNEHTSTGRGPYCRECFRRHNSEYMDRVRAKRKAQAVARKAMISTPIAVVKDAVQKGHRTRDKLKRATRLPWDDLGDALAELAFVNRELRIVRVGEKREFYAR